MDVDDGFVAAIAGRYQIERELGRGGMAVVYLAHDVKHRRPVALKVLRPELGTSLAAERFLQEIAIAARLVHPNILPLHDSGEAAGHLYYVMPYVEGATLRQRLDREVQLPLDEVLSIVRQIASALDYAHAHGVVHRDVKPDNVLLVDGHVLVADFGLAKAISSAASTPLTEHGTVVGTPAYMSPEQCGASGTIDARSDIYSLACMAFEMIAGVTPFRGATAQAMIAHQLANDPPSVCAERDSCPAAVDDVLHRGLAKLPADRYQHAGDFAAALAAASAGRPVLTPLSSVRVRERGRRLRRGVVVSVGALAVVLGAWAISQRALGAKPAVDRSTYAVFPFRHVKLAPNAVLDGDGCARLLHDAMARWEGIHLVDDMRVSDVWTRQQPRTVDDAIGAAESLHAGVLAWGEVSPAPGDSLDIRAVAYDVSRGAGAGREFRVRVASNAIQLDSAFGALADSIVIGGTGLRGAYAVGTRNLQALHQFLDGREALDRFELRAAEDRFRAAAMTDENFAQAHLWLARTMAWRGDQPPAAWLGDAARAVALSASLSARDARHAAALRDLADGQAPQACRRYRELTVSDSADFAAWLGIGDCNARDDAVVRDGRSPTGYAFRGSYYTAVAAYRRALALVPSFHQAERGLAFQRLAGRVLYTEESSLRRGVGVAPDTQRFVAFPSFAAETLAFVPVPYVRAMRTSSHPATERRAVAWAAETMRSLMEDWARAFPSSADAQASYANALEAASAANGVDAPPAEALALARRAAQHTDSADLRTYRWVAVVRLLVKFDSLAAARALSDSLLASTPSPTPYQAGYLGNLAALTGHATRAAALLRVAAADTEHVPFLDADGRRLSLPTDLMGTILELRVYASLDAPHDSVQATFQRANRLFERSVTSGDRAAMKRRLFATPIVLASEDLGASRSTPLAGPDDLLGMRAAIAGGDVAAARAAGARFSSMASSYSPGTVGPDRLLAYATMLLTLGDTVAATRQLEMSLDGIPRARSILLEATPQAAVLGRVLLLRAQLAVRAGDRTTAIRRLGEVEALWRGADAELRTPIDMLRRQL
jgi:eukaryotic-like serine/threonine-protein kinase